MFELKSDNKNYGINFPTNLNEITPDKLEALTSNITLPKYHAIVALCFTVKLYDFAMVVRATANGGGKSTEVVPILVKCDKEEAEKLNLNIGSKIIIDRSSLERGHHINIPTMATSKNATRYLEEDEKSKTVHNIKNKFNVNVNNSLLKSIIGKDSKYDNISIILLEFKIVPITEVVASIPVDSKIIDPFKTKTNALLN